VGVVKKKKREEGAKTHVGWKGGVFFFRRFPAEGNLRGRSEQQMRSLNTTVVMMGLLEDRNLEAPLLLKPQKRREQYKTRNHVGVMPHRKQ